MKSGKHIIVVEDERHLAVGIQYNLEGEGYRVTVFGEGPAALKFIEEHITEVDLIILDLMLPGMSGYAVCEAIRRLTWELPILILSARTLAEDRTRGFDLGANQYLQKPFDLEELLSRIKNLFTLSGKRREATGEQAIPFTTLEIDGAKIDFETYEVTRGEQVTRLTHMEVKLLAYFVTNEGRIIPRQELLENIWDMTGNIQTRAPDQFIMRLRKIFEQDASAPRHFITIRDAGYRFVKNPEGEKPESSAAI
jgi:two-component system, OmpR family, alkaline phosphatase synthesis response regulator PhoP